MLTPRCKITGSSGLQLKAVYLCLLSNCSSFIGHHTVRECELVKTFMDSAPSLTPCSEQMLMINLPAFFFKLKRCLWNFKSPFRFHCVPEKRGGPFELTLPVGHLFVCPFQCNFGVYISELRSLLANLRKIPLPPLKDQVLEHTVLPAKQVTGVHLCHSMAVLLSMPAPVIYYCRSLLFLTFCCK
ncbi:hypothetical protein I79_008292 [Cricetulus griseus]|uniref:Uncharacterized protein n=1 Tax=Cricetulus griseus TaxID=10029 RepID=G3HCS7_CRIGR|nr:hypothetical protein I79_008292 [Cricetulus griseus]